MASALSSDQPTAASLGTEPSGRANSSMPASGAQLTERRVPGAPEAGRDVASQPTSLRSDDSLFALQLQEQSDRYWATRSAEERQAYVEQLDLSYHEIVSEFLALASSAVNRFTEMVSGHTKARRRMIWLSGVLAMFNVILAYTATGTGPTWVGKTTPALSVIAALYSAVLAIFSNLESLENYLQRAQQYRQARENSLNAFRELEMLWHVYVRPFSDTATACVNAANLYRRAVAKDQEVRGQIMERTQSRSEKG